MTKINACVFLLMVCLYSLPVNAQNTKIEFPDYENSDLVNLEIEAIELNKTATILHLKAYDNPRMWLGALNECYLKNSSGKTYELLEAFDFREFSKTLTEDTKFNLSFAPLDPADETIDFLFSKKHDRGIHQIMVKENTFSSAVECIIEGEVIDRPESKILMLTKEESNVLVGDYKKIPIRQGKFRIKIKSEYEEPYQLLFYEEFTKGAFPFITFYADNSTIRMKLYPQDRSDENTIEGSQLTNEYYEYRYLEQKVSNQCYNIHQNYILENYPDKSQTDYRPDTNFILSGNVVPPNAININEEIRLLFKDDEYYNETAKELLKKAEAAGYNEIGEAYDKEFYELRNNGKHLSEKAQELERIGNIINSFISNWQLGYMENNVSLITLSELIRCMVVSQFDYPIYDPAQERTSLYIELFRNKYEKEFPDHPLTQRMNNLINSYMTIKPGRKYIDFTAPDFQGNDITLSSQIEGKIALINLWTIWCGPCRKKGVSMIPVYEEFKDKGFTIVGVVDIERIQDGIQAVMKDQYPWLNLVELKSKQKIWQKYGIEKHGGSTFLVDKDGTILLINPKEEEVRNLLTEKLN